MTKLSLRHSTAHNERAKRHILFHDYKYEYTMIAELITAYFWRGCNLCRDKVTPQQQTINIEQVEDSFMRRFTQGCHTNCWMSCSKVKRQGQIAVYITLTFIYIRKQHINIYIKIMDIFCIFLQKTKCIQNIWVSISRLYWSHLTKKPRKNYTMSFLH